MTDQFPKSYIHTKVDGNSRIVYRIYLDEDNTATYNEIMRYVYQPYDDDEEQQRFEEKYGD